MPMPGTAEALAYVFVAHVLIPFALCSAIAFRQRIAFCFAMMIMAVLLLIAATWVTRIDDGLGALAISEWVVIAIVVTARTTLAQSRPSAPSAGRFVPFQWTLRELVVVATGVAVVLAESRYYASDDTRGLTLIGVTGALVAVVGHWSASQPVKHWIAIGCALCAAIMVFTTIGWGV